MSGKCCAVSTCSKQKKLNYNVLCHKIPKGGNVISKTVRQEWIRRCKRAGKWNPDTSFICSEHLEDTDFERDMQNELLDVPLRHILRKTAIPTLNLPSTKPESSSSAFRKARYKAKIKAFEKREILKVIEENNLKKEIVATDSIKVVIEEEEKGHALDGCTNNEVIQCIDEKYNKLLLEHQQLQNNYSQLRCQLQALRTKVKNVQSQLQYYQFKAKNQRARSNQSRKLPKKSENQIYVFTLHKRKDI